MLVMLLGMAALAVDMGFLWVLRDRLQATADASALAGASQLTPTPDAADAAVVKAEAVAYAQKNLPPGGHGTALAEPDVVLGHWDGDTRTFTTNATGTAAPAGETTTAVKVTTRRAQANGNPAQLFFARVLGIRTADVVTEAIAEWVGGQDYCFYEGVMAGGTLVLGQHAQLHDYYCVYGRKAVYFDEEANVELGSKVGTLASYTGPGGYNNLDEAGIGSALLNGLAPGVFPDSALWESLQSGINFGEHPVYHAGDINNGLDLEPNLAGVYPDGGYTPDQPNKVQAIIDFLDPNKPNAPAPEGISWPSYICSGCVYVGTSLPNDFPQEGWAYIIEGDVTIGEHFTGTRFIIAATGNVTVDEGGKFTNSVPCGPERTRIAVLAGNDLWLGENAELVGVDVIAGHDLYVGEGTYLVDRQFDATIQAARNVWLSEDPTHLGCEEASKPALGPVVGRPRLVN